MKHIKTNAPITKRGVWTLCICIAIISGPSCGTLVGNPKKPDGGGTTTSQFVSSSSLGADLVTTHIDDAIGAIGSDSSSTTNTSLALAGDASLSDYASTCTAGSDGSATVTRELVGSTSESYSRKGKDFTRTRDGSDKSTIVWSQSGTPLTCRDDHAHVNLKYSTINSMTQKITEDRSWTIAVQNVTTNKTIKSRKQSSKGERTFTWSAPTTTNGVITTTRSGVWSVERSEEVENAQSEKTTTKVTTTVASSTPIVTTTNYSTSAPATWTSRTIVSGTIKNEQDDGSIVTMTYSNVVIPAGSNCQPNSGSITGKVLNSSADGADSRDFTVTFSDNGGTVTWSSSGETFDYTPITCSLN